MQPDAGRSYQVTVYETALGSVRRAVVRGGSSEVFVVGPQECTHHLTAAEARQAAAVLTLVADEMEGGSR